MKRDYNRYRVLKTKDVVSALSEGERDILYMLYNKVIEHRKKQGKTYIDFVVVESDWPEYEKVWKMIEERVDKETNSNMGKVTKETKILQG